MTEPLLQGGVSHSPEVFGPDHSRGASGWRRRGTGAGTRSVRIRALGCALLLAATSLQGQPHPDQTRDYFRRQGPSLLREYAGLLEIPNTREHPQGLRHNAEWIRQALSRRGLHSELLELEGAPPLVFASLSGQDTSRTLGIYIHYDGQPVDPSQWAQSPWQPTLYTGRIEEGGTPIPFPRDGESLDPEWRLYARSASDDKAPLIALLGALDAMAEARIPLASNMVILLDGEEESGSPHLEGFMEAYADRLSADLWLICDGPTHQTRTPQLTFGVRGSTGLEITVYGANRYLHSGHYGNWAPNPAMRLAQLLASMKDDQGKVTINGFYDTVAPLEAAVSAAADSIPPFENAMRAELGLAASESDNAPYLDRLLLPALEIRGIESARVGAMARNAIPPQATASINIRLVQGNRVIPMQERVEAHIREQGYTIVRTDPSPAHRLAHPRIAKVVRQPGSPAARTSMDLPISRWVVAQTRKVAGPSLVLMPTMGGTLPLYLFKEKLDSPFVIAPIVNHDNNQHAPNENLRIGNLEYGVVLMASFLTSR